jgi:hypothetical protein
MCGIISKKIGCIDYKIIAFEVNLLGPKLLQEEEEKLGPFWLP